MDLIDLLPPGLYEAVITAVDDKVAHADLVQGDYLFTLESRSLDDIKALGGNDLEDDLRFATAARVSEINRGLYDAFLRPFVLRTVTEQGAALSRALHPHRLQYEVFSDKNPLMGPLAAAAQAVREDRHPVSANNPFLALERMASDTIVNTLNAWTYARDMLVESLFLNTYGSPLLQAAVGLRADPHAQRRRVARDLSREAAANRMAAELQQKLDQGGLAEALLRALIHVRGPERTFDERGFRAFEEIRAAQPEAERMPRATLKSAMREQAFLMGLNEERALAAIPALLPDDARRRQAAKTALLRILGAKGELSEAEKQRLGTHRGVFCSRRVAA